MEKKVVIIYDRKKVDNTVKDSFLKKIFSLYPAARYSNYYRPEIEYHNGHEKLIKRLDIDWNRKSVLIIDDYFNPNCN